MTRAACGTGMAGSWNLDVVVIAAAEIIDDTISWIRRTISTPWVPKVIELLLNELELLRNLLLIIHNIKNDNPKFLGLQRLGPSIIKCGNLVKELSDDLDCADNSLEYIANIQQCRGDFIRVLSNEGFPTPHAETPCGYPNLLVLLNGVENVSATPHKSYRVRSLHDAASQGNISLIYQLVESGDFDIEGVNENEMTALHIAAAQGHILEVNVLLESFSPSGVSAIDKQGRTALHLALVQGDPEIVHMLLRKGIDTSAKTKDGLTALDLAAYSGNLQFVDTLLRSGAGVSPPNYQNASPSHLALAGGFLLVVELLFDRGADISDLTATKVSLLHMAVKSGDKFLVEYMLERGGHIADADINGNTALYIALNHGYIGIAQLLIDRDTGLSATGRYRYKSTALYIATYKGYRNIAKLLIKKGASLSIRGVFYKSPYFQAWMDIKSVVQLFLEKGWEYQREKKHMYCSVQEEYKSISVS